MKKKILKKTMATMLSGVCVVSGVVIPTDTTYAGAGLGYWPEDLPVPNQYYYQNESLQPYGCLLYTSCERTVIYNKVHGNGRL